MANTETLLKSLQWRLVGPFRGGRSVAVAGDPDDPLTAYFGACSGGVWKTRDGGASWKNVSDGYFKTASVGAIAVSESDRNVVYVGMGEACIRGNVTHGDGVYRSNDGGKTWTHLGLEDILHIARVRIHPTNPEIVYVAAFGHAFGPHPARGVYRSTNGGRDWELVLHRDERTGASDLTLDPTNPRVLYAGLWEAQRSPWSLVSGGEGSGIFKTNDGGDSWEELTRNPGLPDGLMGRIGIAVSPAKTDRVWALIESKQGGLYRSDDGGANWELVSDKADLMQRPWYYMHIFAHPTDPETMYTLNLQMWRSTDGGTNHTAIPTPHGDNHDLWIDPKNPNRMVEANDGGACVSFDGGVTWSSIYNQPTAQFYHVTTDTQFPYRIYGAQQDNTTLSIPSYSDRGVISADDTYPVGGSESGYIAVRPDDPNIIFAGGYASRMTRYDHRTKQEVDITVWPDDPIGYGAESMKYRCQWTFPIALSPHDPDTLYVTGNHVFKSRTGGQVFQAISPDLTRGDPETLVPSGGSITLDNVSTEYYGTVFAFAESPAQAGLLWAGSDDGLIHVSKDGGDSWGDATPQVLPDWSLISIIEPSPFDAGTAYAAATRYKLDDFSPYLLRTSDYGQSWELITNGIPEDDFTRVIREDPARQGLLYAGTESGVYVSWDNGDNWKRMGGNLPVVPIHDLIIHDSDLILATHGRSFWVIDDLTPVREWDGIEDQADVAVFSPRQTVRLTPPRRWPSRGMPGYKGYVQAWGNQVKAEIVPDGRGGTRLELLEAGENPPTGVIVHYRVGKENAEKITISILDSNGELVRSYSSDDEDGRAVNNQPGLHRFVWDMRYPEATKLPGTDVALSAYWGGSTIGPLAVPGSYTVRVEVDGQKDEQSFEIVKGPRLETTQEDFQAQFDLLITIRDKLSVVHESVARSRGLREQIRAWKNRLEASDADEAIISAADDLLDKLEAVEGKLVESRSTGGADVFNYPPMVNRKLASLANTAGFGDARPPQQCFDVFDDLAAYADEHIGELNRLWGVDLGALNEQIRHTGVDPIG
ncbi:hypothetical protein BH23CHL2_BH23CHL2_09390 [soil metagenome]